MSDVAIYEKMKDSKERWLGDIPYTWNTRLLKYMFSIKKNIAGETGHQVLSVTQKGIVPKNMTERGQFSLDYSKYQLVEAGDFVMNHMDLLTGWVDISKYNGVTSPDYRVFVNTNPDSFDSQYYKYIFQYCYSNRIFYGLGQGVAGYGRWRLPADMFMNFVLPVPPIDQQRRISCFLDKQCEQIDSIIEEAKSSIAEYKKLREAVIFEAVTRGIKHREKTKNSGIKWIGEISESFSITRMRYIVSEYKAGPFGSSLITEKLNNQGNILVYTPEHIATQRTDLENNLYLPEERRKEMAQFFVHPGNIVFPIVGSLGRAMLITDNMPEGIINQRLAKFKLDESKIDTEYFLWMFARSSFYAQFIEVNCRGSFIVNLTKTIVYDMPVVLPNTLEEQRQISAYLKRKCGLIDELIKQKQSLVKELADYRNSLIFETVTGKRKGV